MAGSKIEKLSLESNHYIKKLIGLEKIENLKELDISYTEVTLEEVMKHPKLEKLKANEEIEQKWKLRRQLKDLSKESIITDLKSKDNAVVERALKGMIAWANLNSNRDNSALYNFFGVEKKHNNGYSEVDYLSEAIKHRDISSETLANVVDATLKSIHDSFKATIEATEILLERKNLEAQKKVCRTFINSIRYYDSGHRSWEDNVQETFYEKLFPKFLPDALAELLPELDDGHAR